MQDHSASHNWSCFGPICFTQIASCMVYSGAHKCGAMRVQCVRVTVLLCLRVPNKNKTRKHVLWDGKNERLGHQYATRLSSRCGCVMWDVLLPLSGCLGDSRRLQMKDIVSPHIWEQVASQGDFTAWSMAWSPQLTVCREKPYNSDSSSWED